MPRANRPNAIASIEFDGFNIAAPALPAVFASVLANEAIGGTLTVNFTDGSSHDYHNVPMRVAREFQDSGPSGSYFNANIRNRY
jgi:hypothetical protein